MPWAFHSTAFREMFLASLTVFKKIGAYSRFHSTVADTSTHWVPIFKLVRDIIPSLFAPSIQQYSVETSFHLCSLRGLGPTSWNFWNPKGARNQIVFPLLLECFVRVALIILRFLQHFKGKFESVYYCMLFAFSRFSIFVP